MKQNPTAFQTSGDTPTQILSRPPTTQTVSDASSKWVYLIIGVLAASLAAMGIFMFLPREKSEKAETVVQNTKTEQSSKPAEKTNRSENIIVENTSQNRQQTTVFPVNSEIDSQPKINSNSTPDGNWSGDWNGKGTYYTATANFTETGGKVNGQIVWTLRRTTNPKKTGKIGMTAVEYVQGTFNPQTRMISLRGVRKEDPNNLVILDRYNLSLIDNQTISGKSINGKFVLKR